MKKIMGIVFMVLGIAAVGLGIIFHLKRQMSVTIIGGADGPTSIFLAGKIGGVPAVTGGILGIVLLAAGIFIIIRKK